MAHRTTEQIIADKIEKLTMAKFRRLAHILVSRSRPMAEVLHGALVKALEERTEPSPERGQQFMDDEGVV